MTHLILLAGLILSCLALADPVAAPVPTITKAPEPKLDQRTVSQPGTTTYETTSPLPLTDYFYPYTDVPYQVNPFPTGRGPQSGYNQCNSTTEGPDSQCQTLIFNSIADFCLWGSPTPNNTIGEVEAAVVAYCARSGHGARVVPSGTFQSVQFMRTEAYIQIVGFINQTAFGLASSDTGGELDPHGADLMGNPLGGLAYSTGFTSGDNVTYMQTQSWNLFIGSGMFCMKFCDPGYPTPNNFCQNIYDLVGCGGNMPSNYSMLQSESVFMSCDGDIQSEVGTYTSDGMTYTWSQPSVLPATSTLPWTPYVPASSNCVTYQSSDLWPVSDLGYQNTAAASSASVSSASSSSASASSASLSSARSGSTSAASSRSGSGTSSGPSSTASSTVKSAASSAMCGIPTRLVYFLVAVVSAAHVLA